MKPYVAALVNRDEHGMAKRVPIGGRMRTRISSQCLKRHWRSADGPWSLSGIEKGLNSFRSRDAVSKKVIEPLRKDYPDDVVDGMEPEFQMAVYGEKGSSKANRQTLLLGDRELVWLASEARSLAGKARDAKDAKRLAKEWRTTCRANLKAMRESVKAPGGLAAAMFGRMVTSDPAANVSAPVHVAHAWTVHAEESEVDYFTAVDDLSSNAPGADIIKESEITSGLYYSYSVVDLPLLISNLSGDEELAGEAASRFVRLVAEVTPAAKLGATAPYSRASFLMVEAGEAQPRSLGEAFRTPCEPRVEPAVQALADQLRAYDMGYGIETERCFMSLNPETKIPEGVLGDLNDLAKWVATAPSRLTR